MTTTDQIKIVVTPFITSPDNFSPSDVLRLMATAVISEGKTLTQHHIDRLGQFLRQVTPIEAERLLWRWSQVAMNTIQERFDITIVFEEQQHVFGTQRTIIAINIKPKT